jgi:hypothetical protein
VLTRLFPLLSVNFDAVMRDYTDGLTPVQLNQVSQQGINVAQKLVAQRSARFHPASRSAIPPCPSCLPLLSEAFHPSAAGCPAVQALTAAA